jgi:hypothetical protein
MYVAFSTQIPPGAVAQGLLKFNGTGVLPGKGIFTF